MTLIEQRDRIVNEVIKPLFKAARFTTSGNTYYKKENDFIKVFNIQSSGFNVEDSVSFYLNIGILFPVWFELNKQPLPGKPKEYDCQFKVRSDALTGGNQSYDLRPKSEIAKFERQVTHDIKNIILPFFDRYKQIEDCVSLDENPKSWSACTHLIGLTMIKKGEIQAGSAIVDKFITQKKPFNAKQIDDFRTALIKR